jgi:hypothetical protein
MIRVEAKAAKTPAHVTTGEIIAPFEQRGRWKVAAKPSPWPYGWIAFGAIGAALVIGLVMWMV